MPTTKQLHRDKYNRGLLENSGEDRKEKCLAKGRFKRCGLRQVDHWRLPGFRQGRPRRPVSAGAAAVLTSHPESPSPFKLIQSMWRQQPQSVTAKLRSPSRQK